MDNEAPKTRIGANQGCVDLESGLPSAGVGCFDSWVSFTISAEDNCSDASITEWYINEDHENELGFIQDGNQIFGDGLAKGDYTLNVKIEDDCGNTVWESSTVSVTWDDCKKPTII